MAEEGNILVEIFNEKNYQLWKIQIEDYIYPKDLYVMLGGKMK